MHEWRRDALESRLAGNERPAQVSIKEVSPFGPQSRSAMLAVSRTVAWILVIGLIAISVVPAPLRPNTGVWHDFEHFCAFLLVGVVWYLAYAHHLMLWLGSAVAFAGGIELIQAAAPGRHARLSDFAFDAFGACVGILISFVVMRRFSGLQAAGLRPRTSISVNRHRIATKRERPPTSP